MRTSGTLKQVYDAAKNHNNGGNEYGGTPHNPVVRYNGEKWMLESDLEPEPNAIVECTLGEFDSYFYETYSDEKFNVSAEVEREFIERFKSEFDNNGNRV